MPSEKFHTLISEINGVVYPVLPSFNNDYSLDTQMTSNYVRYLVESGARILMVTAGTSRLNLLTDNEIKLLNKVVVDSANKDTIIIVASPVVGSTERACEFARHSHEIGADIYLVYYPERFYSVENIFGYFSAISSAAPDLALMLHAMPLRPANPNLGNAIPYDLEIIERLLEIGNFIGMKEESNNLELRRKIGRKFGNDIAIIIAGGGLNSYMQCYQDSICASLASVGSIRPDIEEDFHVYIETNKNKAIEIIDSIETPLFDMCIPLGWHIALKQAISFHNVLSPVERPPMQQLSAEDIEKLRDFMHEKRLI